MKVSTPPSLSDPHSELTLRVEGMSCGSCVAHVENALRQVDGVLEVNVNLATALAGIAVRRGVSTKALVDSVRRAGYQAYVQAYVDDGAVADGLRHAIDLAEENFADQLFIFAWTAGGWFALLLVHGLAPPHTPVWLWLEAAICTAMLLGYPGWRIIRSGVRAMLHFVPNMDALVTIGVGTAFLSSLVGLLLGHLSGFYFDTVGIILLFINGGKYIESRAKHKAGGAVAALATRMPRLATCLRDGEWQDVPLDDLHPGDRIRAVPDGVIPVDGRVVSGSAAIDESMITGESTPKSHGENDMVLGGTIVCEGTLIVEATGVGSDTAMGRILRTVEHAQMGKTRIQRIADRVAGVFVPVVIALAAFTIVGWLAAASFGWMELPVSDSAWGLALRCGVAVLIIACPCAMGLATPVAVLVATGRAALAGILVRSPSALEAVGRADVILFDKTGTLTAGKPVVEEVFDEPVGPVTLDAGELLQVAASAEQFSSHPLAQAIVAKAREDHLVLDEPSSFQSKAGRGVLVEIKGRLIVVGSPSFVRECDIDLEPVQDRVEQLTLAGRTVVLVAIDGTCAGVIGLSDAVRKNASAVVETLLGLGVELALVTGDAPQTARAVAAAVGIKEVYARMLPEEKMEQVNRLRDSGKTVVFVGDGTNDAPALAAADAGIAFAAGTDIANEAADMTLVGSDLRAVATAVQLARRSVRIIKQNLFWAFFYNTVAIPLAAFDKIPPGWAAAAMMFSSISVVLNSLRLRKGGWEMQNAKCRMQNDECRMMNDE